MSVSRPAFNVRARTGNAAFAATSRLWRVLAVHASRPRISVQTNGVGVSIRPNQKHLPTEKTASPVPPFEGVPKGESPPLAVLSPISFRKEMGRRAAQAHKAQKNNCSQWARAFD
jgi:hypothetical protein